MPKKLPGPLLRPKSLQCAGGVTFLAITFTPFIISSMPRDHGSKVNCQ